MITSLCIIYNAGGGYKKRLKGKPRSHSDLLTEEREKVCPCIHNNPPEILRPLSFISPSLKLAYGTVQGNLRSFPVWLVHIYYSLENSRSKDRLFFLLYKRTDAQPKKIGRPGPKKRGAAERKNGRPPKKKIAPLENKNIGAPKKK